jgi:REP element-mobilizing transposase RayT
MDEITLLRRRNLPHWDVSGATYFITACLEGSIPATGRLDIATYRTELQNRDRPPEFTEEEWESRLWKLAFARLDDWLDARPKVRWLERADLADMVRNALLYFAGERYDVIAYAVMPSHMHWVFRPRAEWVATLPVEPLYRSPRERIMHSVKRHSGYQCNLVLARQGTFWQSESHDHWIRDVNELERIIRYVELNPVKAGLVKNSEEWNWSSASHRLRTGTQFGLPLLKLA